MIEIFGDLYYIDFEVLDDFLIIDKKIGKDKIEKLKSVTETLDAKGKVISTEIITSDNIKQLEVNGVKFEIIRNFIEDLGQASELNSEDFDSALGSRNLKKMSLRFKLAFNTLVFYNILRKVD